MIKFYKIKKDNLIKFAVFTARNNDTLRIIDKNGNEQLLESPFKNKLIKAYFSWEDYLIQLGFEIICVLYVENKKELNEFIFYKNNYN